LISPALPFCLFVMAGLDPAIHLSSFGLQGVDARLKAGHDD
jgi:hypothetical protein